jgi:soluble lytic murein transglycosylase-like protein
LPARCCFSEVVIPNGDVSRRSEESLFVFFCLSSVFISLPAAGRCSSVVPNPQLVSLARAAAAAHQLYPELICAICEQESAWNPWAIRYEPAFYEKYIRPLVDSGRIAPSPGTSAATESRARAFSWGLMQVMGQVAREHGFAGASLAQLCDPAIGLDVGCRVFAAKLAAAEGNVTRALLLWNGGANREYSVEVLARAEKYRS